MELEMKPSRDVKGLELPKLGRNGRVIYGKGRWDAERYEDFAKRVKKLNAGIAITSDTMDDAFRTAASQLTNDMCDRKALASMVKRVSSRSVSPI
jgi:hypothetical protein